MPDFIRDPVVMTAAWLGLVFYWLDGWYGVAFGVAGLSGPVLLIAWHFAAAGGRLGSGKSFWPT